MSKTFLFLLCFFIFTLSIFIWLKLDKNYLSSRTLSFLKKNGLSQQVQIANLYFSPRLVKTIAGKQEEARIIIDITNTLPSFVQLELSYDPTLISFLKITTNQYQNTSLDTIDQVSGRISYAFIPIRQSIHNNSDTVVYLTFTTNNIQKDTSTQILFLPKTSLLTQNQSNILLKTKPLTINITQATQAAYPSAPFPTPALILHKGK